MPEHVPLRIIPEKDRKAIQQLFIGKVCDRLGFEETMKIMVDAKNTILESRSKTH